MKKILEKVCAKEDLSLGESEQAMDLILETEVPVEQVSAFLGALRAKGETVDELLGFTKSLRSKAKTVTFQRQDVMDVCGTGGDASGSFNISTATGFVVAGAGAAVAKHGNRSVSSQCGSADVLEALGINILMSLEKSVMCVEEIGFGFFFAPHYHPLLSKVAALRKAIGVRTVFNLLGPLVHPAKLSRQLVGIYDQNKLELFKDVLQGCGTSVGMIVSADDGMDELSLKSETKAVIFDGAAVSHLKLRPETFGMETRLNANLQSAGPKEGAMIIENILKGEVSDRTNIVLMNSAAALVVAGIATDFKNGTERARESILSGRAFEIVTKLRAVR